MVLSDLPQPLTHMFRSRYLRSVCKQSELLSAQSVLGNVREPMLFMHHIGLTRWKASIMNRFESSRRPVEGKV